MMASGKGSIEGFSIKIINFIKYAPPELIIGLVYQTRMDTGVRLIVTYWYN